jgi:hypothetical protein
MTLDRFLPATPPDEPAASAETLRDEEALRDEETLRDER